MLFNQWLNFEFELKQVKSNLRGNFVFFRFIIFKLFYHLVDVFENPIPRYV